MTHVPEPEFLKYREVADILNVDIATVRRLVDRKQLVATRVTRRNPRIHRNELDRFIKSRTDNA